MSKALPAALQERVMARRPQGLQSVSKSLAR